MPDPFGCDAGVCKHLCVELLPDGVWSVRAELVSNIDSFPQMVMEFGRHFNSRDFVSNAAMFTDLRSNIPNLPCPTSEQFQLYRCSVVRDAWCHKCT